MTFAQDLYYDKSGTDPNKTADWEVAKKQGFKLVDDYLETFSGLHKWLEDTKKFAYKHGYVETLFGRQRRLPDLKSKTQTLKSNAERQSINAPIQGTGSDFTLLSVIKINHWLKENNMKSVMVATVHDSIVFDIFIPELPTVSAAVKHIMEHVHEPYIDTQIPVTIDLELGVNYGATFEVALEECQSITNVDAFQDWIHQSQLKKYQKEITTLCGQGWDKNQVLEFLKSHHRPIKDLSEFLSDLYSQ